MSFLKFLEIRNNSIYEFIFTRMILLLDYFRYRMVFDRVDNFYKNPTLLYFELETINRCNGSCSFCPVNKNDDSREFKLMDEELFKNIIGQLKQLGYKGSISISSNNEPFLDKRILNFIQYAKQELPNAYHHLYTNGTLLTVDKFIESMKYLDLLVIDNYNDKKELIPSVKEIDFVIENPEYLERVDIVLRLENEILTSRGGEAKNRSKFVKFKSSCILPFTQMIVRPDGKTSLCCADALGKMTLGDLNEDRLIDVWNNENYQYVREKLHQKKYARQNLGLCKNCDHFGPLKWI